MTFPPEPGCPVPLQTSQSSPLILFLITLTGFDPWPSPLPFHWFSLLRKTGFKKQVNKPNVGLKPKHWADGKWLIIVMIRKLFCSLMHLLLRFNYKYKDVEFVLFPAKQNMFKWEILHHPQHVINIWFFRLYLIYKYEICIWETACSFACANHGKDTNKTCMKGKKQEKSRKTAQSAELRIVCSSGTSITAQGSKVGATTAGDFITINCSWIYAWNFIHSCVPGL